MGIPGILHSYSLECGRVFALGLAVDSFSGPLCLLKNLCWNVGVVHCVRQPVLYHTTSNKKSALFGDG